MMRKIVALLLTFVALPQVVSAQARKSERASVTQLVNATTITLEYSRPVMRGRTDAFGKIVHWGEIWTPGANWATTFEVNRDVDLNGHRIPKGKYSVWLIPAKDSAWTFFLNKNARRFHVSRPKDTSEDVVRFQVKPLVAAPLQALLWYFPYVQQDTAILHMHWETTVIPLRIVTVPVPQLATTEQNRRELIGEYEVTRLSDSTVTKTLISVENGKLFYTSNFGGTNPLKTEFARFGDNMFRRLVAQDDNQPGENVFVFTPKPDGSVTFEVRNAETNVLFGTGRRVK
jgi:hypothetical protein